MKDYKILFGDMHSNPHHEQIDELPAWLKQARELFDFWPIAYYPYYVRKDESGLGLEDVHDLKIVKEDFEKVKKLCSLANSENFPMFLGYEWQGAGLDGDHNVFFLNNHEDIKFPLRYKELYEEYKDKEAIAIPHHTAYALGHRGKNWDTHIAEFSPFSEVYSSHGSSESDESSIMMDRHIHMGPRCDSGSYNTALKKGIEVGTICSGDNHSVPGVYGFGLAAVLAKSKSKEDIFDGLKKARVYGVTKDKILLDYTLDGAVLSESVFENKEASLKLDVVGSSAIDRVEIIDKDKVIMMLPHISFEEDNYENNNIRFKFKLEFGWGPDRRVFPDIESKLWKANLKTKGQILSVEKCWSNFGQKINYQTDNEIDFELTSYKTTATGKWMGPSAVTTEGFIFEIEDDINNSLILNVDSKEYELKIKDILDGSFLIPLMEESKKLIKDRFNFDTYYRSDPFWHNAYKIKVNKGFEEKTYHFKKEIKIDTTKYDALRVKVYELNGSIAFSSPIYIKH